MLCPLRDNVEKTGTAGRATDDIIQHMRIACWKHKITNTHSECVILKAFKRQQRLCTSVSAVRHTYIACLRNKLYADLQV
jgi:hypothetical protein